MNIFANLINLIKPKYNSNGSITPEVYSKMRQKEIAVLEKRYDLSTVQGIQAIPIPRKKVAPGSSPSVTGQIEYYLQRKGGTYETDCKIDLAIACYKKANELMPFSSTSYSLESYMRLPRYLRKLRRFDEARKEEENIKNSLGLPTDAFVVPFSLTKGEFIEISLLGGSSRKRVGELYKEYLQEREIEHIKLVDQAHYDWLWEHMPDLCPKSFGGYRRMKSSNSPNFQKLCRAALENGRDILK